MNQDLLLNLVIDKFIVHDIPSKYSAYHLKHNPSKLNPLPVLSDIETPFSPSLERFFKDKMSSSIGSSNSIKIKYKDQLGSVPNQIEEYFSNNKNDILSSQKIALHLYDTQNAKNSGSLLLFVFCHVANINAVAILKVEREEGVQIEKIKTDDGHTSFNMEHIENLMLTKKTKLFKIALFYNSNDITQGLLSDQQLGVSSNKNVALYFLDDFLSCQLVDDPSVTTRNFFESTQKYINESNLPPESRAKLLTNVLSVLSSNNHTINVQEFAESYLDIGKADDFVKFIKESEVPVTSFVKDISLVNNKLKRMQYIFESGIYVITPEGLPESHLSYAGIEDGKMKMEIRDHLKKVGAK